MDTHHTQEEEEEEEEEEKVVVDWQTLTPRERNTFEKICKAFLRASGYTVIDAREEKKEDTN